MMTNPVEQFSEAIRASGLTPPEVIEADGQLHRFHVEGDRSGSCNGWYCLHMDGRAAGIFGSWKTGFSSTWAANGKRINAAERQAFDELRQAARSKAEADRRAEHEAGARIAQAIAATHQ